MGAAFSALSGAIAASALYSDETKASASLLRQASGAFDVLAGRIIDLSEPDHVVLSPLGGTSQSVNVVIEPDGVIGRRDATTLAQFSVGEEVVVEGHWAGSVFHSLVFTNLFRYAAGVVTAFDRASSTVSIDQRVFLLEDDAVFFERGHVFPRESFGAGLTGRNVTASFRVHPDSKHPIVAMLGIRD